MKITVGSTYGLTLSNIPYSPIKVETTLIIERELPELGNEELELAINEINDRVKQYLKLDLDRKLRDANEHQKQLKKSIERAT